MADTMAKETLRTSENEGTLQLQPSGRWAVCRPGRQPVELTSGEVFGIETPGTDKLVLTSIEFRHFRNGGGEYYSIGGCLYDGMRAALI